MSENKQDNFEDTVDFIMDYLWGTWDVEDLKEEIKNRLNIKPDYEEKLNQYSYEICELHCNGEGYDREDIENILKKIIQ